MGTEERVAIPKTMSYVAIVPWKEPEDSNKRLADWKEKSTGN